MTHLEQQLQQRIRLLPLQALDPLRETRVHKQRLLPRSRVHSDQRVGALDRLAAHVLAVAAGALGLRDAAVHGAQALEQVLDRLAQAGVRRRLRRPGRVAAGGRDGEQREDGHAGGLVLVRHVRVVADRGEAVELVPIAVLVVRAEVDVV